MTKYNGLNAILSVASGAIVATGLQAEAPVSGAWTPGEITALVGAIGVVLTVVFAGIVNVLGALRKRVDETAAKIDVIEGHVNSAATKSDAIIKAQETQLKMQETTIAKLEQTAALVAQAQALTTAHSAAATPVLVAPAPAAPVGIAAVAEAAKTIAEARPQLDDMQATGESTNSIVTEIEKKP